MVRDRVIYIHRESERERERQMINIRNEICGTECGEREGGRKREFKKDRGTETKS